MPLLLLGGLTSHRLDLLLWRLDFFKTLSFWSGYTFCCFYHRLLLRYFGLFKSPCFNRVKS